MTVEAQTTSNADVKTATIETTQTGATDTGTVAATGTDTGQTTTTTTENFRTRIVDSLNLQGPERDKEMKRLERFASEADIYKSNRELEKKLSSGDVRVKLPENATPEQVAEYRKSLGVPQTPEEYDTNVDGFIFGEADKPIVGEFAKAMHAVNADPAAVKAGVQWYAQHMEQILAQRAQADHDAEVAVKIELGKEWGQEAKLNFNLINATLEQYPALKDALWQARSEHGQGGYVGYNKGVLQDLVRMARELNPAATILPGSNNPGQSLSTELQQLKGMMADSNSEYWKGPNAEKNQARYAELKEAEMKMASRNAA